MHTYMNTVVADPLRHQNCSQRHARGGEENEQHTGEDDAPRQHARVVVPSPRGHEGEASAHCDLSCCVNLIFCTRWLWCNRLP